MEQGHAMRISYRSISVKIICIRVAYGKILFLRCGYLLPSFGFFDKTFGPYKPHASQLKHISTSFSLDRPSFSKTSPGLRTFFWFLFFPTSVLLN